MKKVLILGGGYGALSLIKGLRFGDLKDFDFTLVSKEKEHYQSVLLHEVISKARDVTIKYEDVLPSEVCFIQDEVKEIKKDIVLGAKGEYAYDILILALGFSSDDFGIPGVREHAHSLVNFKDSLEIYQKLQERLAQGEMEIVVCGGGFSGIELLGNLALDLREKTGVDFKLKCIEAMPRIIPMFNEEMGLVAKEYLENLGVEFHLNCKILECREDGVLVESEGEKQVIKSDFTLWTAGVKGNQVVANSPFFTSARSKVEVDAFLHPIHPEMQNIFVLGDCAAIKDPLTGRFYPPTAQIANQAGKYLASVFNSHFAIKEPFVYESKGTICSLGSRYAIASFGTLHFKGYFASLLKRLVEFRWVIKLRGLKCFM